jgi:NADPH:quinone reductase
MKIIGMTGFGGPEVLGVHEVPEPHAGPAAVRIRVRAAGVNPADIMLRAGMISPGEAKPPWALGMDASGVIDEVGEGSRWAVGDRVMGMALPFSVHGGAYVEYLTAPDDSITRIPDITTFEEAATVPLNGLTATQTLDKLALTRGQTLAVVGATGTLGAYVVQLAASAGLIVIADGTAEDEAFLRALGATHFVTRGEGYVERVRKIVPGGVDGLADIASRKDDVLGAVADGGAYASVLGWPGSPQREIRFELVQVSDDYLAHEKLDVLATAVAVGELTPRVAAVLTAANAGEAHRRLAAGRLRGRIVLTF